MGDELIGQAQGGIAIEGPDPIENEAVGLVDLEGADRFGEGVDDLTEGEALDDESVDREARSAGCWLVGSSLAHQHCGGGLCQIRAEPSRR